MKIIAKFYKYIPLSQKEHFVYLQNYLEETIWLTPLKNFNDPFESKYSIITTPDSVLRDPKMFDALLKQHQKNGESGLTDEEFRKRISSPEFIEELKNNPSYENFLNNGALCLTTKNNDIPMWAYYANDHKGCCVEFELDFSYICERANIDPQKIDEFVNNINQGSDILSFKLRQSPYEFVFSKVRYDSEVPLINFEELNKLQNNYDRIEYLVKNSVGVKDSGWKNEEEFRLIANFNSEECGLLSLKDYVPFLRVTAVIMGSRMEEGIEKIVYRLCKLRNIEISKASCLVENRHRKIRINPYIDVIAPIITSIEEKSPLLES